MIVFSSSSTSTSISISSRGAAAEQHRPQQTTISQSHDQWNVTEEETDSMLANAMNKLSVQQREHVYQDIHGITEVVEETEDMLNQCIIGMQLELDMAPPKRTKGYMAALSMDASWTRSRRIWLLFLRACKYSPKEAANCLLHHLDQKLENYGIHKLAKDFTLSDMDQDDMECIQNGHMQILPKRDRGGRAVIFLSALHERYRNIHNQMKCVDYIIWKALQDEDTQRKGIVFVAYAVGDLSTAELKADPQLIIQGAAKLNSFPARIVGLHHCFNTSLFRPVSMLIRKLFEDRLHVRVRDCSGSSLEVRYQLMTYGIPTDAIPVNDEGELNPQRHLEWLQAQRRLEDDQQQSRSTEHSIAQPNIESSSPPPNYPSSQSIAVPTKFDVLYGRGNATHTGNIRLNAMIDSLRPQYDSASKKEKTKITTSLVAQVKSLPGRFLKFDAGLWVQVDDSIARKKVAQTFRSQRRGPTNKEETTPTIINTAVSIISGDSDGEGNHAPVNLKRSQVEMENVVTPSMHGIEINFEADDDDAWFDSLDRISTIPDFEWTDNEPVVSPPRKKVFRLS